MSLLDTLIATQKANNEQVAVDTAKRIWEVLTYWGVPRDGNYRTAPIEVCPGVFLVDATVGSGVIYQQDICPHCGNALPPVSAESLKELIDRAEIIRGFPCNACGKAKHVVPLTRRSDDLEDGYTIASEGEV